MKTRPEAVQYDSGSFLSMVEHARKHGRDFEHDVHVDPSKARAMCTSCLQEWFVHESASGRYSFLVKPGKPF